MNKKGIVIHCSASEFGSSIEIDKWHKQKGWVGIGYHFVICNCQIENNNYFNFMDGSIERGRDLDKSGAHAKGYNDYIGICLIGNTEFTLAQFNSLKKLVIELALDYGIDSKNIIGHNEVSSKTCPNFDVKSFIEDLGI